MMQLKEFQKRTLAALQDYFRACVEKRDANTAFYRRLYAVMAWACPKPCP